MWRGHHDGEGLLGRRVRALDLLHQVLGGVFDVLERPALPDPLDVHDLPSDGRAIVWEVVRERGDLIEQRPAEPARKRERQRDDDDDRRDLAQPGPANQRHRRAEKEGDQEGQRDRDEDGTRPVQARDGQHEGGQDQQPRWGVRVGGSEVTHSRRWGTTSPTLRLVNVPLLLSSGSVMTVRPRGAREVPRLQWDLQRLNVGRIEGGTREPRGPGASSYSVRLTDLIIS